MIKGVGVDCAMILIAVFREAGVVSAGDVVEYSPQWFLHHSEEKYINELSKYAREITEAEALPGDVVVYKTGRTYAHGGIIINPGWPAIIHASPEAKMVIQDRGDGGRMGDRPRRFFTCFGVA
jgi:cell wall-associated NlpC family hydrolase